MRILFVTNSARYNFAEPMGMMILSQVLRDSGHETRFVSDDYASAAETLKSWSPDVVATTCTTGEHKGQFELNRELKKVRPFFSIMGGPHPTFFPQMIQEHGIDAICRGEGEGAILDLVNALSNEDDITLIKNLYVKAEDGTIHENPMRELIADLDTVPFADRESYYRLHDRAALHGVPHFMASRGCVFNCTYCFNKKYFEDYAGLGSRFRFRSPENLVEECVRVVRDYGADQIIFHDDIFPVRPGWLEKFRKLYTERVGLPWSCYTRIELIKPEVCELLSAAGCHAVLVGLESGNESLRKQMRGRFMSNDDVRKKCQMLHDANIRFQTTNIVGFPGETLESALETLSLNLDVMPALASTFFFQPYPGTVAGEMARRMGMYDGDPDGCGTTVVEIGRNYRIADAEKLARLRSLMGPAVGFPFLARFVPYLIYLPLGPLYALISKLWVGYCSRFRLYPTKFRPVRFVKSTLMFLFGNGPY